jgi:hypothetical protein
MALSTPLLILLLVSYVLFCGFIMYFCVLADPESGDMAYLMQVALPNKVWNQLGKVMGEKKMDILQALLDRALVFVYLAVVLGVWTIVFWYIYPWITLSAHVSNFHKIVGYAVFVACFSSWRKAMKTSPGIITTKSFKRFDHYPYDNLFFLPDRRCDSTNLIRIPRSKFDRLKYNENVPRYDHFCGWVFNTIGEENYRWFLLFLAVHVFMCAYGGTVCILLFLGEINDKKLLELTFFDRATGENIRSNWFIVFQYLFARNTMEFAALIVMVVMGLALGGFLGYHVSHSYSCEGMEVRVFHVFTWEPLDLTLPRLIHQVYLTSANQTTNENGKWTDVKRWYKAEQKKYKEAVKKGLVKSSADSATPATAAPVVQDGDVTCTGGSSSEPTQQQTRQQECFDPGPMPTNVYDRGFIENWKEVIFPPSRRKGYPGGYSRPRPPNPKSAQSGEPRPKGAPARPKPIQPVLSNKTD